MDLMDKLMEISKSIPDKMDHIQNEESTKTAFIMPFISALGYDIFDPSEVVPEFTADIGAKKGEKVDYAIIIDNDPTILIECKNCHSKLEKEHAYQLCRYFLVTPARFAILTNGITYQFYTDIDEKNKMDSKPFLEIDMDNLKENQVKELEKFSKSSFNLNDILTVASELKYKIEIKKVMKRQLNNPSDDFVKFFGKQVYKGILTQNIKEQFTPLIKSAFNEYIKEQVDTRLKTALNVIENGEKNSTEEKNIDPEKKDVTTKPTNFNYKGSRIHSFTFNGNEYKTTSWINMLLEISNIMLKEHKPEFNKVLELKGRQRPYFSTNPGEMRNPKKLNNTDIFIETNLSANGIVGLSKRIIVLFGYNEDDLIIDTR
jgi:predicted type IV restriction endonuclease